MKCKRSNNQHCSWDMHNLEIFIVGESICFNDRGCFRYFYMKSIITTNFSTANNRYTVCKHEDINNQVTDFQKEQEEEITFYRSVLSYSNLKRLQRLK